MPIKLCPIAAGISQKATLTVIGVLADMEKSYVDSTEVTRRWIAKRKQ